MISLVLTGPAENREQKVWRFGVIFWHDSPNDQTALKGIREALEGTKVPHTLIVEEADSKSDEARRILRRFKEEELDLVFAMGTQAALLAAQEIKELPVVFTAVTNPVESGVVPSWKGSGTNLAGNSNWISSEMVLSVFRLAVPKLQKLGILRSATSGVVSAAELRSMRDHLGENPPVQILEEIVKGVEGIKPAVERLAAQAVQAIWIPIDYDIYKNMDLVLEAVKLHELPLVSSSLKATQAGAVAGVVVDYRMLGKRAVVIALDILQGNKNPGEIAVDTMRGYQVIVNLGAARRCNYELPLSLLVIADSILEDTAPKEKRDDG